jgi:hypothetical protein
MLAEMPDITIGLRRAQRASPGSESGRSVTIKALVFAGIPPARRRRADGVALVRSARAVLNH